MAKNNPKASPKPFSKPGANVKKSATVNKMPKSLYSTGSAPARPPSYRKKVDGKWVTMIAGEEQPAETAQATPIPTPTPTPIPSAPNTVSILFAPTKTNETKSYAESVESKPTEGELSKMEIMTFSTRKDRNHKDIIITSNGITPNYLECAHKFLPGGKQYGDMVKNDPFGDGKPDFETFYNSLKSTKKVEYFNNKEVEIIIDIPEFKSEGTTVINILQAVGKEMAKGTKKPVIYLNCSRPTNEELKETINVVGNLKFDGKVQHVDFTTPIFKFLTDFTKQINNFSALEKLDVIIRADQYRENDVAVTHLKYALPFYSLNFKNCDPKYLSGNMQDPKNIPSSGRKYLESEWEHKSNPENTGLKEEFGEKMVIRKNI
ncbi:hypothetical protein B0J14DRAFT_568824 [Halenospora varia]|nr:hypothetical protein B0J14DRAFT_568824 [Halenospora varia]